MANQKYWFHICKVLHKSHNYIMQGQSFKGLTSPATMKFPDKSLTLPDLTTKLQLHD